MKNMTACVIGATGLVGKKLVELLLNDSRYTKIKIFVRKNKGLVHAKLEQHIVDFADEKSWGELLKGDVLFSALGTTLKQAGSKEKEFEVDYTFNLNFAKRAKENGIKHYVLVSSVGANPKSYIFYPRMKGQLEEAVKTLGFENVAILRPASLVGKRSESRFIEEVSIPIVRFITRFMLKKYRPIDDIIVARAMLASVIQPHPSKRVFENSDLFEMSENYHSHQQN
jgi:uncharacterized protein YbjT (DUF2867 family)